MQNLWDACLRRLEQELPAQQFNTWIRPLAPEADPAADTLVLAAPNRFVLELVRERFAARIERLANEASGRNLGLRLVLARAAEMTSRAPLPAAAARGRAGRPVPERGRLNRGFTFDTFVTGKANQLARAAAMQVAENPGTAYNPLFIYGGVGLGKTHLIQAIGNQLREARPAGQDPLHPRRAVRVRRGARLPAQGLRRVQALLPLARPPADRRHPVLRRQEPHAGRVLLRLQRADRSAQAGRHHLRHLSRRRSPAWRTG